jgi:hypothetical protein
MLVAPSFEGASALMILSSAIAHGSCIALCVVFLWLKKGDRFFGI